jgi:hypothetical protein
VAFDDLPPPSGPAGALNQLIDRGVITNFAAHFDGHRLHVTAIASGQDELSIARAKRQVQQAIAGSFPDAVVGIWAGGDALGAQPTQRAPHTQSGGDEL